MLCIQPYRKTERDGHITEFPCGRCTHCRIQRSREWTLRLLHESSDWPEKYFLTLTYSDEHPSFDGRLHKTHLQDWIRETRRSAPIRYFACGEYGDRYGRPHYHLILFRKAQGLPPLCQPADKLQTIPKWEYGFGYVGFVTADSIRYTTDYIFNAFDGDYGKQIYGDLPRPFRLMSKGLGRSFIEANQTQFNQRPYLTQNGVQVSLPRYYLKRTGQSTMSHAFKVDDAGFYVDDVYESLVDRLKAEELSQSKTPMSQRLQNDRNLLKKHNLIKKDKL